MESDMGLLFSKPFEVPQWLKPFCDLNNRLHFLHVEDQEVGCSLHLEGFQLDLYDQLIALELWEHRPDSKQLEFVAGNTYVVVSLQGSTDLLLQIVQGSPSFDCEIRPHVATFKWQRFIVN